MCNLSALKGRHAWGGHQTCGPARTAEPWSQGTPPKDALGSSRLRAQEVSVCQASKDLVRRGEAPFICWPYVYIYTCM